MRVTRWKVGAWLSRPYVELLLWHYKSLAEAYKESDPERANRLSYIAIGLQYAITPQPVANPERESPSKKG